MPQALCVFAAAARGSADGSVFDHREHVASWSTHFPGVVIHTEPSVFEVLVCEQDLLGLREEQPWLEETQGDQFPLVGLQPKSQVSILCSLGFS